MAQDWRSIKRGFVIQMKDDGRYVQGILANGRPEDPVIYLTEYLTWAKAWRKEEAAIKAAQRVREKEGECTVLAFEYNSYTDERVILYEADF